MVSARAIFRFIYGSFYFVLCTLLVCLLLITPGDAIYQAYENNQWYNIWFLASCLVGILIVVSFIYALRLYNNKTILASIPKSWVPIEKGDMPKRVFKMITAGLDRSAIIQFESRPRVIPDVLDDAQSAVSYVSEKQEEEGAKRGLQLLKLRKKEAVEEELGVSVPPRRPVWGEIEHRGWASPESPDLSDLQYSTVLSELPNLIEAKALTLAPAVPGSTTEPPMLEPDAMALLERPLSFGLRQYLNHLFELGVLPMDATTTEFLTMYEYSRFSNRPLTNSQFRDIMQLFALLLRSMGPFDPAILDPVDEEGNDARAPYESDIDSDAPPTTPSSPRSTASQSTASSRLRVNMPPRNSSAATWHQYRTAPSTLHARSTGALSHSSSMSSLAQRRQVYHSPSNMSLRSKISQSSGASVIRLAGRTDATDLPYVLTMADSR